MPVAIKFDEASLDAARSGVIWGGVWLEIGDHSFPEPNWNDLAVAVAVEILTCVRDVYHGADEGEVRFFDGPFWVKFRSRQAGSVAITTSGYAAAICDQGEFANLVHQIEDASRALLASCQARGWAAQDDVRRLEALVIGN